MAATPSSTTESQGEGVAAWCTSEERVCLAWGDLWASGACHAPLEQGPCPDAHWLLLDAHAMPRGTCAPRPCPPAQLPSAGRCLEEAEAREMCWSGAVHLDALGRLRCGASPGWTAILKTHVRCQQPTFQPSNYTFNSTKDDGYYFTDDGYYNSTDDGYYNSTDDGYYNATDDGYYNSTYYRGYNFTDDDFNATDVYDSAPDYQPVTNVTAYNITDEYPPLASKSMYVKAEVTAGDRRAVKADAHGQGDIGEGPPVAAAHAPIRLSVRVLVAGALCSLLATRVTRC
ncbi:hypothetical protein R5R35_013868 [Gryllus longicercus]|uniref:Uncharacterized protein n=1 Tax=Gryllus longicercus TaxID=2509291 RepID=A0AAN9VT05_9ORTH